jgi:hypothetical protein
VWPRWTKPFPIRFLDKGWDSVSRRPGIYIIRRRRPVARIGGIDRSGILYIGKSGIVRQRLANFWDSNHTASAFLWWHPEIARILLARRLRRTSDLDRIIPTLTVQVASPIRAGELDRAERAVLYAYLQRYGEAPPLNLSFPNRWKGIPRRRDLFWGEKGIQGRV